VSDHERPEMTALRELEHLVHNLGEELAAFRKRAIQAESELKTLQERVGGSGASVTELETANAELRRRLDAAGGRAKVMLDRVRFLRQQQDRDGEK
jgi:hypothetical protein